MSLVGVGSEYVQKGPIGYNVNQTVMGILNRKLLS